jgi:hypothetical protein
MSVMAQFCLETEKRVTITAVQCKTELCYFAALQSVDVRGEQVS